MWYLTILVSIVCVIFIILYLYTRRILKSLYEELHYTVQEKSNFTLFTSAMNNHYEKKIIQEMNQIQEQMQHALQGYQKNENEIKKMITNISHDIRTPLTSIQGYLEMMEMSQDPIEIKRYYTIIKNRLDDVTTMLNEFFIYTKIQCSDATLPRKESVVYPLLCTYLLNYMDLLKEHQLAPEVICEDESIKAMLDEESFRRICTNLIVNTARYGTKPFRIYVRQKDDMVYIQFENKVESTSLDVERMFDRFYKGNDVRTQKGSGLGLAIVKELCERMQGGIHAELIEDILRITLTLHA